LARLLDFNADSTYLAINKKKNRFSTKHYIIIKLIMATMKLKENQKRGIGLFFAGVGSLLSVISIRLPKEYGLPVLIFATLLLIVGAILFFISRK
jgi:hypothetical protein